MVWFNGDQNLAIILVCRHEDNNARGIHLKFCVGGGGWQGGSKVDGRTYVGARGSKNGFQPFLFAGARGEGKTQGGGRVFELSSPADGGSWGGGQGMS